MTCFPRPWVFLLEEEWFDECTFSLGSSFDDTGQIEELDIRAFVFDDSGDASQRCELVCSRFGGRLGD